jgi:hypothetical protein
MPVAGDLVTNVVSSFVFEGIRRSYGAIRTNLKRRQAINRAFDSHSEEKHQTAKALSDLEKVIGADRGQLTEPVAQFLKELEASAIPDTILKAVLSGINPELLFAPFDLVYKSFVPPLDFESKAFFNALVTAIRQRAESQVTDLGLLDFIQAQNQTLSAQLDTVIRSLNLAADSPEAIPIGLLSDARLKMARAIESGNRLMSVETLQGIKRCNIRQLVVPARLRIPGSSPSRESELSYQTFRSSLNRNVILGDPGGGKSTLTQLLCYDLAYTIGLNSSHPSKQGFDPIRLPLRIILRSYDKRRKQMPNYGLLDYLIDENSLALDGDKHLTGRIIVRLLSLGSAVLIFDGLDEILDVEPRREIVTFIEQFAGVYAGCPILVTSRSVGYRDAPMSAEFEIYDLARLDTAEVQIFAQNLIKQVGRLKTAEAKEKSLAFKRQTDSIAQDLRENPLMLGLMVYIYMYRGDVPSNRPEIYKECATLMFEKWDQRRDIIFEIPTDFDLLDVFAFLASRIFGSAETEDGVPKDWLTTSLRIFFEQWYLEKPKAIKVARSLVDFLTGRAWVMCEIGPNVFKFTHRTFLEYFFARHLISTSESVSELIKGKLFDHIIRSKWDVIVHLALHSAVFRDVGKMNQAADTIIGIMRSVTLPANEELAFITFAAKALEYFVLPEPKYRELVQTVCAVAIRIGGTATVSAVETIDVLTRTTQKREGLAKPAIYDLLIEKLSEPAGPARSFAAYVCSGKRVPRTLPGGRIIRRAPYGRLRIMTGPRREYFSPLITKLERMNYQRALTDKHEARLYLAMYRSRRCELVKRHGLGAMVGDGPDLVYQYLNDLLLEVIEEVTMHERMPDRLDKSVLRDDWDLIEYLANQIDKIDQPAIITIPELKEEAKFGIDEVFGTVYRCLVDHGLPKTKSSRSLVDWGKVILVLAAYIDINSPPGEETSRIYRRDPESENGRERLCEFMPSGPMKRLLAALEQSPVVGKINSWNQGEIRFSR